MNTQSSRGNSGFVSSESEYIPCGQPEQVPRHGTACTGSGTGHSALSENSNFTARTAAVGCTQDSECGILAMMSQSGVISGTDVSINEMISDFTLPPIASGRVSLRIRFSRVSVRNAGFEGI
jgi:hypothetical protein